MQLREEEDNRDGYIIRIVSEKLAKRPEKHKFLLVFTDGEPSALDYQQDGILDTHEAVKLARKKWYGSNRNFHRRRRSEKSNLSINEEHL